jgi:phosphinothricin acetyltransferase
MARGVVVRAAAPDDRAAIAAIYNEGIAEGRSTFETEPRSAAEIAGWSADRRYPLLVAALDGRVVGWARLGPYSPRRCYAGIGEGSVYVARSERGRGIGSALAEALRGECEGRGFHKIVGRLFADNQASRRLVAAHGFREVGVHLRHGWLDGRWRDVLVVELLLVPGPGR